MIFLGMNHNFILGSESDRTFGTFEETNKKIIVYVANKIVKTSEHFSTQRTPIACNSRSVETMQLDRIDKDFRGPLAPKKKETDFTFSCNTCSKTFASKDVLAQHMKSHGLAFIKGLK